MVLDLILKRSIPMIIKGIGILFFFPLGYSDSLSKKLWVVDNLLLDHIELPQVVVVAVHLVILFAGWVKGIILRHFH